MVAGIYKCLFSKVSPLHLRFARRSSPAYRSMIKDKSLRQRETYLLLLVETGLSPWPSYSPSRGWGCKYKSHSSCLHEFRVPLTALIKQIVPTKVRVYLFYYIETKDSPRDPYTPLSGVGGVDLNSRLLVLARVSSLAYRPEFRWIMV